MSPIRIPLMALASRGEDMKKPTNPNDLVLEAWAQGYLVGSLIIMGFTTMANMRRGVLLHKLILLELILGIWQGFWLFFGSPVDTWWLSVGAIFLNASWSLHNVISWMKIKPFLSRPVSRIFIGTVILVQPYWVVEIYANFAYFHGVNDLFKRTRPWEALCRDPWWIFTTVALFWTIKTQYELTLREIIHISPRFGIMLLAMLLSIVFVILDICSVTSAFKSSLPVGINPFWKLAFVFKCLTDTIVLDDFKTALDRLRAFKISRIGSFSQDTSDRRTRDHLSLVNTWENLAAEARKAELPSPDGALVNSSHTHFPGYPESRPASRKQKDKKNVPTVHKESVASSHRDFCTTALNPEDMVPSALGDPPPNSMETAHLRHMKNGDRTDVDSWDSTGFKEEDYARALRDVEGQHSSADQQRIEAQSPMVSPSREKAQHDHNPT